MCGHPGHELNSPDMVGVMWADGEAGLMMEQRVLPNGMGGNRLPIRVLIRV
jgi:hypothetical protein